MSYTLDVPPAARGALRVTLLTRNADKLRLRVRLMVIVGREEFSFGQSRWMTEREWTYVLEPQLSAMARGAQLNFAVAREGGR